MITKFLLVLTFLGMCVAPLVALADWDFGDPAKWVQAPDPNGWDVRVTTPRILADDFLCRSLDPISDIHFWGSWKDDIVGEIERVHLSIHADIPADQSSTGYSLPGEELWAREYYPGDPGTDPNVIIRQVGTGQQGWYDPGLTPPEVLPGNHYGIWQVNVFLPKEDWFWQEGTAADPIVYWLDIQVDVKSADGTNEVDFGWKTAIDHWNDDAVWGDWVPGTPKPEGDQWNELWDPIETGRSLDLAFVITTVPEPGTIMIVGLGLLAFLRRRK